MDIQRIVVGGVDTHKDLHVAAVVDEQDRVLGSESFHCWDRDSDSALVKSIPSSSGFIRVNPVRPVAGTGRRATRWPGPGCQSKACAAAVNSNVAVSVNRRPKCITGYECGGDASSIRRSTVRKKLVADAARAYLPARFTLRPWRNWQTR